MYMKVNTSLCKGDANQWEDKDDMMILFRDSRACQHASSHCVDRSLGGSAAHWHHLPSPHIGHRKKLLASVGSSMTHSIRVALCGSHGISTIPPTHNHFSRAPHNLLCVLRHRPPPSRLGGGNLKSNKHHRLATRSSNATRCNLTMQRTKNRLLT
jgi:hypothetical protein